MSFSTVAVLLLLTSFCHSAPLKCGENELLSFGNPSMCLSFFSGPATRAEAALNCYANGGRLGEVYYDHSHEVWGMIQNSSLKEQNFWVALAIGFNGVNSTSLAYSVGSHSANSTVCTKTDFTYTRTEIDCDTKLPYICLLPFLSQRKPPTVITKDHQGWAQNGEFCYQVQYVTDSWQNAQARCKSLDARLASIRTAEEQEWILQYLRSKRIDSLVWSTMDSEFFPDSLTELKKWEDTSCFSIDPISRWVWYVDDCDSHRLPLCVRNCNSSPNSTTEPISA